MKVLLINPPFSYQTSWMQITEPLGLLYLAAYVRQFSSHEIAVLDGLANHEVTKIHPHQYWYGISHDAMLEQVAAYQPEVIGLSCMFSRKKADFLACATWIKKRFPGVVMVGGGTYPSLFPEETMRSGFFDYVILGEGEQSFVALLNALRGPKRSFESLDGLAFYGRNHEIVVTPKTAFIEDLDRVPFPARDLIDYEAYATRKTVLHGLGLRRSASILTSRSCPNRCSFCSMFKMHGPKWRGRSASNVVNEMVELVQKYRVQDLFVMDDNFTFDRDRVLDICRGIKASGIRIRWNTPNGIAINTLDRELLTEMKSSGCRGICIAIESGDEELRNVTIGKRLKNDKIDAVVKLAAELKLFVIGFYIIGMPGETREKFDKTLEQITRLPFNGVAAAFANPLPGTRLYQECLDNQWTILPHDELTDNLLYRPYIVTPDFSESELMRREKLFYRTFIRAKLLTLLKDTVCMRNGFFYPPFLMRILQDRLFRG
ncbi:MAG: cobalamin-dependent protein [Kiritimatiellae bacterium]|nr:cobalamin-dependent protein [Kiritimatiellia bacterium]